MNDDRFQFQPWYIKLWRFRWYLLLPLEVAYCFVYLRLHGKKDYSVRTIWAIRRGGTDIRMNWVWTLEECEERCKEHDEKQK